MAYDDTAIDIKDMESGQFQCIESPINQSAPFTINSSKRSCVNGVYLRWNHVDLQVATKNKQSKQILHDISGEALPGELLVLMGPSGAGKSSLLDCLSGRNKRHMGTVTVNGEPWSKDMDKISSYVLQDDKFLSVLKVHEHLLFQAELRMGNHTTQKEKHERVHQVLNEIGLIKCQNAIIGVGSDGHGSMRGISGGERKRLSFATELITNPSLLFVDEPTSGLDSFMAENVVKQLQTVAREGRTVIATIHQPSSELFPLFDKLLLLVNGHVVYHDVCHKSVDYFDSLGYPCPNYSNPTDFFLRQLIPKYGPTQQQDEKRIDELIYAWKQRNYRSGTDGTSTESSSHEAHTLKKIKEDTLSNQLGWTSQIYLLSRRNIVCSIRDRVTFRARTMQSLFIGIFAGLVFLQTSLTQKGVQNFVGALFFMTVNQMFSAAQPEFTSIPSELPIVLREVKGGLYGITSWYFAKNISELPKQLFFPFVFVLPSYLMIGFGYTFQMFFTMFFIFALVSSACTGLGYMIACITRRAQVAIIVGQLCLLPFLIFGGLFLNSNSVSDYLKWLQYISPVKYGYEGNMQAFWKEQDVIPCLPNEECIYKSGEQVLRSFGMDSRSIFENALLLCALNVGFRLIGLISIYWHVRKQ